jgi:hypothetical protein
VREWTEDLQTATDSAAFFNLTKGEAQEICDQVHGAVAEWRQTAEAANAPRREIRDLEDAFLTL